MITIKLSNRSHSKTGPEISIGNLGSQAVEFSHVLKVKQLQGRMQFALLKSFPY